MLFGLRTAFNFFLVFDLYFYLNKIKAALAVLKLKLLLET